VKQYAQKFISDPGKQNGLYWESPEGQPKSLVGPLVAYATDEGYNLRPTPPASHGLLPDTDKRGLCQGRRESYIVTVR